VRVCLYMCVSACMCVRVSVCMRAADLTKHPVQMDGVRA
jgi:hypothetical protein